MKNKKKSSDFSQLKKKVFLQALSIMVIAFIVVAVVYIFLWRKRGADLIILVFQRLFGIDYDTLLNLYQVIFRNNREVIWLISIALVFLLLFRFLLTWFIRYFNEINNGIDALLEEGGKEITLSLEMSVIEKKLNTVYQTLEKRALETKLAEQRKNDLVMYLAHDIRTPLTSVIGYLSLLDESPDMPVEQRAKYTHITLEKAYRLEALVNEFFEITRYNLQQITLEKENIDLYYMLIQMIDEFYPILSKNGNTASLHANENISVYGDPVKLARVLNNILKNAVSYSYPDTQIDIYVEMASDNIIISIQNKGKTIPPEKLSSIFEKFYRLDEARTSYTGGAGLGLSIAKEIIVLHGGTISVKSENNITTFTITLPI